MWPTSNSEACDRVKWCEAATESELYCTGMWKPPKGTILAPWATWRSYNGVLLKGSLDSGADAYCLFCTCLPAATWFLRTAGCCCCCCRVDSVAERLLLLMAGGAVVEMGRDDRTRPGDRGAERADTALRPLGRALASFILSQLRKSRVERVRKNILTSLCSSCNPRLKVQKPKIIAELSNSAYDPTYFSVSGRPISPIAGWSYFSSA